MIMYHKGFRPEVKERGKLLRMRRNILFTLFFAVLVEFIVFGTNFRAVGEDLLFPIKEAQEDILVYSAVYEVEVEIPDAPKTESTTTSTSLSLLTDENTDSTELKEKDDKAESDSKAAVPPLPPIPSYALSLNGILREPNPEAALSSFAEADCQNNVFLKAAKSWNEEAANFVAPTDADILKAKKSIIRNANNLQRIFKNNPSQEKAWKKKLNWSVFVKELNKKETPPNFYVLAATFAQLSTGDFGLELNCFAALRRSMQNYVTLYAVRGNPEEAELAYGRVAKMLSVLMVEAAKNPHADTQRTVESCLLWMEWTGQAEKMVEHTRNLWGTTNFSVNVTEHLFQRLASREIVEPQPLNEEVGQVMIRGNTLFTGTTGLTLVPNREKAQIRFRLQGNAVGESVSTSGPAVVRSSVNTVILGEKDIFFSSSGFTTLPAVAKITPNSQIISARSANGRNLGQNAIRTRAEQQKPQTEKTLTTRQTTRLQTHLDQEFRTSFAEMNKNFRENLRVPLEQRGLELTRTRTSSDTQMNIYAFLSTRRGLMSATSPPQMIQAKENPSDMIVSVHESAVQNVATGFFGGMLLDKETNKKLRGTVPAGFSLATENEVAEEEDSAPAIMFSNQLPLSVSFVDGKILMVMNGTRFIINEKTYPALRITVTYRLEAADGKFYLVRDGDFELLPPNFDPEIDKQLPSNIISIRRIMARRLKELLAEKYEFENIPLRSSGKKETAPKLLSNDQHELEPVAITIHDGWMQIGFRVVPKTPEKTPPSKNAAKKAS